MTKNQLKKRESERRAKLIEANKAKTALKLAQRMQNLDSKYEKLFQQQMAKQLKHYERKKQIMKNKVAKQYGTKLTDKVRAVRKLDKVIRISDTIRQKAIKEFQLRCKLSRTDSTGMLLLIDKGTYVHRTKSVAGHYFPKGKYPHLIINILNVWPIDSRTNREQLDNIGLSRKHNLIDHIGLEEYSRLESMANDKELKNQVRDSRYRQQVYDIYKPLNEERKQQLGKFYKIH